jgi:hypothetical protein
MKRLHSTLGMLLALSLTAGALPAYAAEDTPSVPYSTEVQEVDSPDTSQTIKAAPKPVLQQDTYGENEQVAVIVELLDDPVLEDYTPENSGKSAGEEVSEYLAGNEAKKQSEKLLKKQDKVIAQIESLVKAGNQKSKVIVQWTSLTNAFTIRLPYKYLEQIREIEGVKRAYVSHEYERPELPAVSYTDSKVYGYSLFQAGVQSAWQQGYTGKGQLVAVLDTGIDIIQNEEGIVTGAHEAFRETSFYSYTKNQEIDWDLRYDDKSIEKFLEEHELWANTTEEKEEHITFENNALYKNKKVPFGFDYADWDFNTRPTDSDHGSHVSGTVAGFSADSEGTIQFSGAAPDAQILAMKVFPDKEKGAQEFSIVSALEDSLALGADVINLSLGSDNGFANDDSIKRDVFGRLQQAGIIMMTSAGNANTSTEYTVYNDKSLAENPDISMVGSPSVYETNVSVASMENSVNASRYLTWSADEESGEALFNDPRKNLAFLFGGQDIPIYKVEGVGKLEEYEAAGFGKDKTGFALVKRGEIAFAEKALNAQNFSYTDEEGNPFGILGVLIYDANPEGTNMITMQLSGSEIPAAFIGGKDGAAIAAALDAGKEVKINISSESKTVPSDEAGQMSDFTSWGTAPGLELKPEITAPGGNVWSAVANSNDSSTGETYKGEYEMMSGTSMAAPHMSGITALVRQRVQNDPAFQDLDALEQSNVINALLISTADPIKDPDGIYYSVRRQGAGLVDASEAVKSQAYLKTEGTLVPKLELKDDPNRTGSYPYSFDIVNTSDKAVAYSGSILLQTPKAENEETHYGTRLLMQTQNEDLKTIDLGSITVEAGSTKTISGTIELNAEEKAYLNSLYKNGTFVEGFVFLENEDENIPDLGLPVLAFFGDWTEAPIFDGNSWFDNKEGNFWEQESTWLEGINESASYASVNGVKEGIFTLGLNPYFDGEQGVFYKENFTLSPNEDGYFDGLDKTALYQLRDARAIVMEVRNAATNELYVRKSDRNLNKTQWNAAQNYAVPDSLHESIDFSWDGTDLEGNKLPSGTRVVVSFTAYTDGDYSRLGVKYNEEKEKDEPDMNNIEPNVLEPTFNGHVQNKKGDVLSYPVTIDTEAPRLFQNALTFEERDGKVFVKGKIYDRHGSLASVSVVPVVTRTDKETGESKEVNDLANPFYTRTIMDAGTRAVSFEADVTEYVYDKEETEGDKERYEHSWNGGILVFAADYGVNSRSYFAHVSTAAGLSLSTYKEVLYAGDTYELQVTDNTGKTGEVMLTSSNPEVAEIDEEGKITAKSFGQTVITASKGDAKAEAIIAVQELPEEAESFVLIPEQSAALKPETSAVVSIDKLFPSDLNTENSIWSFEADQKDADVTIEKDPSGYFATITPKAKEAEEKETDGENYRKKKEPEAVYTPLPAISGTLSVTIGSVTKTARLQWNAGYETPDSDDLISTAPNSRQTLFTNVGEAVTLGAKYRNEAAHIAGDVKTELEGLKLDGSNWFLPAQPYEAALVNEEDYTLPETIAAFAQSEDGSERELEVIYDTKTGEFSLPIAPDALETLIIKANGVEAKGNAAGTLTKETAAKPDGIYGPFDWILVSGNGSLEIIENENEGGIPFEEASFLSDTAGTAVVRVTTKEGISPAYQIEFTIVTLEDNTNSITAPESLTLQTGELKELETEIHSNIEDDSAVLTSFAPAVVKVENGKLRANKSGKALVKAALKSDSGTYAITEVTVEAGADKSLLNTSIAYGETKIAEEDYNEVSDIVKAAIEEALAKAKAVQEDLKADQLDVDLAWSSLQNALVLLNYTSHRAELAAEMEASRPVLENLDLYTGDTEAFKEAYEKAKAVLDSTYSDENKLSEAREALQAARAKLVTKESLQDKHLLQVLVEHAEEVEAKLDDYISDSKEAFIKALENAKAVLEKADSQQEIDDARNTLQSALLALRLKADDSLLKELDAFVQTVKALDRSEYSKEQLETIDKAYAEILTAIENGKELDAAAGAKLDELRKAALQIIANPAVKPEQNSSNEDKTQQETNQQPENTNSPETAENKNPAQTDTKPAPAGKNISASINVKTGTDSQAVLFVLLLTGAAALLIALAVLKKRKSASK